MIKEVWRGYLFDGKRIYLTEVKNGTYIKLQGQGTGTATLKGTISEDVSLSNIGVIRCKDLAPRRQLLTDDVYMADVSGFQYVSVQVSGMKSVYAVIYGDVDEVEPTEHDEHEYRAIIILETYKQVVKIKNMQVRS